VALDEQGILGFYSLSMFTLALDSIPVRGRSTERAARDFARLLGMRSRAGSCQNDAYPTSPSPSPSPSLLRSQGCWAVE
jgi:hypothetical protein